MKEQIHEDPKIVAAAERQMQAWSMNDSLADGLLRRRDDAHLPGRVHSYLAISRETGSGGRSIADIVGHRLGWEVLGRELLDRIAQRYRSNRMMLNLVDETPSNWIYDVVGSWMDSKIVPHETYVVQLDRVVHAAAKTANVVFVGRGAQFLLPREKGFAVRLVASPPFRQQNLMRRFGMSASEALRFIGKTDQGRIEFGRRFFHHDVTDPHLYDMVLNTERLGLEGAAELILAAMARRHLT